MTEPIENVGKATRADLDGILELQAANQIERGGMLSAELSRIRIAEMMESIRIGVLTA